MARKLGMPGEGNACEDSKEANKKIRLSFQDNCDI
jgi:hypothetical protein